MITVTSQSLVCEAGVTTLDQLPQDVFLLICHILLSDSAILPSFRRLMTVPWMDVKSKYIRPLFRLLHVCRSWRTIILEAHALWKYALVDGPDGMPDKLSTFLLDRAGDAPVVISVVFSNETLPATVQYLEGRQLTVSHLQLYRRQTDTTRPTESSPLPSPPLTPFLFNPTLESVCFISDEEALAFEDEERVDGYDFVAHSLGSGALTIRGLAIHSVQNSLPFATFPKLTHLHLCFKMSRALSPNPFEELLHLLSGTPALLYLHLSHPQAYFPLHDPFVGPRVPLPQLQRVTMVWFDWRLCNALLDHLHLPVTVHVNLKDVCLPEEGILHHPETMLDLARLHPLPFFPHLSRLYLSHSISGITLAAEGDPYPDTTSLARRPRGRLELTWRIPGPLDFSRGWIMNLSSHLPLASVRTMHLELHTGNNRWLTTVLASAVALEELVIFGSAGERAFLVNLAQELGPQWVQVRCPGLKTLGVQVELPVPGARWAEWMVWEVFARVGGVVSGSRAGLGLRLDRLLLEIKEEADGDELEDHRPGAQSRRDQQWEEYHLMVSECMALLGQDVGEVVKTYYDEDNTVGLSGSFGTGHKDWLEEESLAQQRYWMLDKEEVRWDPAYA
ncbi:uncharacterized protein BXZ73DRAFT_77502 [Epithele typhae]|uniref:uncharacterized protein n=1 Tax=Epithele typhae TaxID=378194 RepID=UPI0020073B55|nr:uncharacterized protein BXZ73DRAFT_77502 [Epithele typhae]KAH9932813.1 hypothetical protein BXZ73DRAFT_77502 [Epithele typhae]